MLFFARIFLLAFKTKIETFFFTNFSMFFFLFAAIFKNTFFYSRCQKIKQFVFSFRRWFSHGLRNSAKYSVSFVVDHLRLDQLYILRLLGRKMGPTLFAEFLDFYKRRLKNKAVIKSGKEDVESQEMKVLNQSKEKKPKKSKKKGKNGKKRN